MKKQLLLSEAGLRGEVDRVLNTYWRGREGFVIPDAWICLA